LNAVQKKNVQVIHILKNRIGMNEAEYRSLLAGFGVESSTQLTVPAGRKVVRYLKLQCGDSRGRYQGSARQDMISQAQADWIAQHEDRLGWDGQPERLAGFIRRVTKSQKTVAELTRYEATKVIVALQKTKRRPRRATR